MKKTIAAILIFVQIFIAVPGFSQTKPDVKGFDQTIFDYHFSRADRELSPGHWISEAHRGIGLAINAWELFASELYDNPLVFQAAKKQLEDWSAEELEDRFYRWLCGRFFGSALETSAQEIALQLSGIHQRYTYHLDSGGNIIYENETNDPSVIRPGEDDRDYIQDLEKWRLGTEQRISSETASLEASLVRMFPELLDYIPESMRSSLGSIIVSAAENAVKTIRREFEGIAAREERIFTVRRTGDVWSLRRKSEDEAARTITAQLIAEAEDVCSRGIADLNCRIEEASAGTGDLAILGDEWLELYKQQFERGLKAWEEAEERFFIRRMEWEQDSLRLFDEGQESWYLAFKQFEEERNKWELKTKELFESGEALFKKVSENLEKAISQARVEIEYIIQIRTEASSAKAKALVDMYLLSANGLCSSRETIQFWLQQYDADNTPDFPSEGFLIWFDNEKQKIWEQVIINYKDRDEYIYDEEILLSYLENPEESYLFDKALEAFKNKHFLLTEIEGINQGNLSEQILMAEKVLELGLLKTNSFRFFVEILRTYESYNSYLVKAQETRDRIVVEYGNLFNSAALKDILDKDAISDDFFLDEYQIALIKAKAVVQYWEKQTVMAQAVLDYAEDISAGRMTDAEGIRAWELAKENYEVSILLYEEELRGLNKLGIDIQEKQKTLDILAQKMNEAEELLNKLNKEYMSFISARVANDNENLLWEFNSKYSELVTKYDLLSQTGSNAVYFDNIKTILEICSFENRETFAYIHNLLINGDGQNLQSLVSIEDTVNWLTNFNYDIYSTEDNEVYGLEPENPHYDLIQYLILKKNELAKMATEEGNDTFSIIKDYNELINSLYASYRVETETNLRIRLAAISLFSEQHDADQTISDWYYTVIGLPTKNEKTEFDTLLEIIKEKVQKSTIALLNERLRIEISALNSLLNKKTEENDIGSFLSQFCLVDKNTAETVYKALIVFEETGFFNLFLDNIEPDEIINWFISGGSVFAGSDAFLADFYSEYQFNSEIYGLLKNNGKASPFMANQIWIDASQGLEKLFLKYNLKAEDTLLPDIQIVCESLIKMPGTFTVNASRFLFEIDQAINGLPDLIVSEFNGWKYSLMEYIAYTALYLNKNPLRSTFELADAQKEIYNRYFELELYFESVDPADEETMRNLNRLFFEIADDEVLVHYEYLITLYWENGKKETVTNTMKHWRQFVKEEYLVDQDMIFQGSDAWLSGMLYDIREQAELENRYLTDLFNNCFLEYSSDLDIGEIIENYYQAAMKWQNYLDKINSLKTDLINLGKSYDYSMMDQETMFAELDTLEKTINDQKVVFETLKDEYFLLGNEFTSTGNNYDAQYIVVKKFYDELENKRFLFEIQDSIRRWASTAYLEAETNDLKKCEESLGRARTVLDVLSNLYSGEKNRPYKNEKYAELYSEYERSFSDLLFSIKAYNILDSFISKEKVRNEKAFAIYQDSLHSLGYVPIFPEKYVSPDDRTEWTIVDMISIKNGMLCFSQDVSGKIKGTEIEKIRDYFNANIIPENGIHSISQFDIALNDLNQRMSGYLKNNSTFSQWALARDYLISTLISKNSDLTFLKDNLYRADLLKSGQSLGSLTYLESPWSERKAVSRYYDNIKGLVLEEQKNAWEKLNEAERADLEFYVIITLSGIGNDYLYGFSQYTSYYDYEKAYKRVNGFYKDARDINNQWWNPGRYFYSEMRSVDKFVAGRIQTTFNQIKDYYDNWKDGLSINITQIESTKKDYDESCIRLCLLDGMSTDNKKISWDDICVSFEITGGLEISELKALENKWNEMIRQTNNSCSKVTGALAELVKWSQALREESRYALENQWINDSLEMQKNENEYFELAGDYIEGIIDKTVLVKAAEKTFGNEAAAWKKHLENIERTLFNDLITYTEHSSEYFVEYCILGFDYVLAITDIYNTKYNKELESRESEWEMQRRDIEKKYLEWQKTVDLILERGRQDWKEGNQRFEDVYKHWYTNFQHEYNSVSDAWADAYLAGMTDKEEWLSRAAIAANEASGEAFLSIIGTEAERLSRVMDMRYPLGIITTDAANEADKILTDLLGRPGIQNLNNAFNVLNGMASLSQPVIRRGMGNGIWDERTIRAAAADLSREINAEFAARETRKLAINIGSLAEEAIQSFSLTVDKANKNFTRNIDDMFIIQGQWRKNGNNYIKDIITGSTFFQPVISKTHEVKGYVNFEMEPFEVKTNFDENYLANLDSYAIMILIENIYAEMDTLTDEIFGIGEEKKIIKKEISENVFKGLVYHNNTVKKEYESVLINLEERHLNPGKFGSHIGYKPATREIKGDVKSRDKMFYDEGSGELGRLLSDFIYWSIIDNQGLALLAVAPWDKPLWDDHGSVFEAPSLRSAAGFTTQVAVTAASIALTPLTAGLSYVGLMGILALVDVGDDLLFSGLDVMCGYKTFDEAGFEFGKALLTSTISSVGSGVFGGVTGSGLTKMAMNTTTDAIGKVAIQSAMVGVQTISTGILTSAVNGVTYNHESGWGYSKEIFDAGLKNSMINGLASTASTFTSGMLKIANSGLDYEKLKGFSVVNQKNVDRLNGLIGSLGGESLKYAFTGDFTLNILNTGLFTNGNFNHGLLELHLGSGDPRMNIGSSGANVSIDNIVGSIQGAMVWNVNNRITRYTEKNDFKEKITLRGQYGFGDKKQKNQLWDILSGRNPILTEKGKDYTAETDIIDGKRTIKIGNYTAGMSDEDQMLLAVVLGHEAYRDGIVSLDNNLETQRAVLGHTEMAIRMVMDGQMMAFNDNLLKDIVEYFYSNGNLDLFNAYVDNNYDSSGDYWRLVKDENGKWDWIEDGDLNFNFDLKDMEISSVLGKRSDLAYTINMKTGIVTIKYSDMTPLFATILGINLGLQDGSKYFTTMVFNKNYALDSFVNKTLNMAETSKDIITQINKQTVMINDLVANKIKYGFEGQQYNEWVVNENSTTMNCVGLVSYLFQTQSLYTVANYGSNPFFERVTTAMPGDLIAFVAYKDTDNGREYNNHIVGWMGSYGPAQGKNDQIYESAFGTGPRFDTLQKLTNFYSKNNYVSEQYIYRFKK